MSGPFGSLMCSRLIVSVCGAHAKKGCETVRTGTSSCSGVLYSPLPLRCDSASAAWCFIPARWAISNSGSDRLKMRSGQFSRGLGHGKDQTERFVISSNRETGSLQIKAWKWFSHITSRHSLCVAASFSSLSFKVRD